MTQIQLIITDQRKSPEGSGQAQHLCHPCSTLVIIPSKIEYSGIKNKPPSATDQLSRLFLSGYQMPHGSS